MAITTLILMMVGLSVHIVKLKRDDLNQIVLPALVKLRSQKVMKKRVRGNCRGMKCHSNREFLLVMILILLLSGDVEKNPGPISLDQFKEMNKSQRGKVSKPEMELLLTQLAENNDEGGNPNADVLKELREIKKELKEIKDLKVTVEDHEAKITNLQNEVKNLKDAVIAQQKFWEETDKEKRCKKLIFLGIEENQTEDNIKVGNLLQYLQISGEVEIDEVKRLGRIRESEDEGDVTHKRPLLVEVKSREMRNNVLKHARNLKDVEDGNWMKTVFIKADEHPEVRKEMKRLNDVFKDEKKKAENTGLEIKFDRKARKVTRNGETIDSFRVLSLFQ